MKKIVALLCCMAILIALCGCTNKDAAKEELLGYLEEYDFANAYEFLQGQKEDVLAYVEDDTLNNLEDSFIVLSDVDTEDYALAQKSTIEAIQLIQLFPNQDNEKSQEVLNMYKQLSDDLRIKMKWKEYDACYEEYNETVLLDVTIMGKARVNLSSSSWREFQKAVNDLDAMAQKMRLNYDISDEKCVAYLNAIETVINGGYSMISGLNMEDDSLWKGGWDMYLSGLKEMEAVDQDRKTDMKEELKFAVYCLDLMDQSDSSDSTTK